MGETADNPELYDVKGEYYRLTNNVIELFNLGVISKTVLRKSKEKINRWHRANAYKQIGTNS